MKKIFLLFTISLLASEMAFAQDTIRLRSGEVIPAQVQEIGISEIRYKQWSNLEGPTYVQPKSEIISITYKNGTKDNFIIISAPTQTATASTVPPDDDILTDSHIDQTNPRYYLLKYDNKSASNLALDGKPLSKEEALKILGQDNYDTFMSGNKLASSTAWMPPISVISTFGGIGLACAGYKNVQNNKNISSGVSMATWGTISAAIGIHLFIAGIIVQRIASKRYHGVIDDYNDQVLARRKSNPATLSFNLSPSSAALTLSF